MTDSPTGRYKIGSLSRLTGLKPELLRAWQRRFSLFEPERTEGSHRLYTADDLRLALHVKDLLAEGLSIGAVASRGRASLLEEAWARVGEPGQGAVAPTDLPAELEALKDEVLRCAVALDPRGLRAALDRAQAIASPEEFLTGVFRPAAVALGELWAGGECSVAGEHLASAMLRERLLGLVRRVAPPPGRAAPEVLVACAPDDYHENGGLCTAVRLAELGWRVTWLGAATPMADLDQACRTRRPHAVYVSSTLPDTFAGCRDALLAFARRWQGAFDLVVGGGGVPASDPDLEAAGVRLSRGWTPPVTPIG